MAIWFCAIFSFFFSTAAKFLRTESVKCPACAVIAKSRARHVHVMSLNLLTSRKPHLFNLRLPMNRYTFVLPSENQNAFHLLSICANAVYNVIQSLNRQGHLIDQIFLQRYTRVFEIRRRVLWVKKWRLAQFFSAFARNRMTPYVANVHGNHYTSTYLILSFLSDRPIFCTFQLFNSSRWGGGGGGGGGGGLGETSTCHSCSACMNVHNSRTISWNLE